MKTVDTKLFLDNLCELTEEGKTVSTVVSGGSMLPFLSGNRDYVFLQKPQRKLRTGDIALFVRDNNEYVLHRVKRSGAEGYFFLGDRQTHPEGPVTEDKIRCIAVKVKRKGKIITPKSLCWKFFSTIWIRAVFLRPLVFAVVAIFHKKHKK